MVLMVLCVAAISAVALDRHSVFVSALAAVGLLFVVVLTATDEFSSCIENSPQSCSREHSVEVNGKMAQNEQTFIMIKPDAVERRLIGRIIDRFEQRGYKLIAMKMCTPSLDHLKVHYQDLKDKPFFNDLIAYMSSGAVVAMVWEGLDIVKQGRLMLGATNPLASNPGTIRGDFSVQTGRNIVHGSDGIESAKREIAHWFKADEINNWGNALNKWVYE